MAVNVSEPGASALTAVRVAALGEIQARGYAEEFAVVLGLGGGESFAIITAPRRAPDWQMTFGATSETPMVGRQLVRAVMSVRDAVRAVAWVRIGASSGRVDLLLEDLQSGQPAEHLWTEQVDSGQWHSGAANGLLTR